MGAWGSGAFENDSAADWVWELEDETDASVMIEALAAVVDTPLDEQPEADVASEAVAAAEIVAAARGARAIDLPTEANAWISANPDAVEPGLVALARAAVERVSIDSELKDLWDEAADESWSVAIADLLARLR